MQKALDTVISEDQSCTISNRTILHTVSTNRDMIDVLNKLNKNLSV